MTAGSTRSWSRTCYQRRKARYPVCVGGEYAAPPEDCGGIPGYYMMLEAIEDEEHPDHEELLEWVGGDFDSVTVDLEAINRRLEPFR